MKKLIAIAVVLALVAGVAFAQTANGITVNAWGRGAFSPLKFVSAPQDGKGNIEKVDPTDPNSKDKEGEAYTGTGASWGGDKARIDFRINGANDYVGFNVGAVAEADQLAGNDDAAKIWVKPFGSEALKLSVGIFVDHTLRGKIGNLDAGFSSMVGLGTPEEDAIFQRFTSNAGQGGAPHGYMISSAPVDGLFIGLAVNGGLDLGWSGTGTVASKAFQYLQLGAGYNIANIGHIRAQYLGGWSGTVDTTDADKSKYYEPGKLARIEAAFALTAVQGLLVDLGGKFWLPLEVKDAAGSKFYSNGIDFSLGTTFNAAPFGIGFRVDIDGLGANPKAGDTVIGLDKDDKSERGANTVIRLVPTFDLEGATLGLDVAFKLVGESKKANGDGKEDNTSQLAFGAFVKKGLPNGSLIAGLSYTLAPNNKDGKPVGSSVFQIPIILEYAFF